jgi:hypothetical protein
MGKVFNIRPELHALFLLLILGCSSKKESFVIKEEDTRVLVKAAFDRIDREKLPVIFNTQRAQLIKARLDKQTKPIDQVNASIEYAVELLKSGNTSEAINLFEQVIQYLEQNKIPLDLATKRNIYSYVAIAYLRAGEIENCVQNHTHQSCFIPIKEEGIHTLPFGSGHAIKIYEFLLKEFPTDLESKYLLNIAYMTLGKYPQEVPAAYRIDPAWFKNKVSIKPFRDIAPDLGINHTSHAGGAVMDDFNNDGWLDIVITSWSPDDQMTLYINNGDGTFTDQTSAYGLTGYTSGLNLNQTDFNNDGWIDLYIMRGAWLLTEGDIPNTLLMNAGNGKFVDVTVKAGLTHDAPTQTSAWTDIDLDGWLDLVIANESLPGMDRGIDLYINQKDGTFRHASQEYGLTMNHFFKGLVATDANNDKYPDLYFSSLGDGTFLMINQGSKGKKGFVQVGPESNIGLPKKCFPSWSFDYDNDGKDDLFTSAYTNDGTPAVHWMLSHMGKADPGLLPKLYHNKGEAVFEEVGQDMGLDEVTFTMGCNFGDINTDGFLDFYLSTGNPIYQSLVPNKMYLNMEGRKFEDVSYSGGFANIQKGHGVAFGDADHDGDEDLYVVIGGAYDGDMFYNCFFENPNEHNNNWIVLKLKGVAANAAAIGAKVALTVEENGKERMIYRTVSSGASFGGNSLALEVGLRKASGIKQILVQWPCKDCPDQIYSGLEINKAYSLTQGQIKPDLLAYTKAPFKTKVHS